MKANHLLRTLAVLGIAMFPLAVAAQRGVGDPVGIGRQAEKPTVVSLTGTLNEIHVAPCEHTTGRSTLGTHLMVETADNRILNVHLGPSQRVEDIVRQLSLDQLVTIEVFETPQLKADERIAQKVTQAGKTFVLRDDNLRPVWAPRQFAAYDGQWRGRYAEYNPCPMRAYPGSYRYTNGYGYGYGPRWGRGYGRYGPTVDRPYDRPGWRRDYFYRGQSW